MIDVKRHKHTQQCSRRSDTEERSDTTEEETPHTWRLRLSWAELSRVERFCIELRIKGEREREAWRTKTTDCQEESGEAGRRRKSLPARTNERKKEMERGREGGRKGEKEKDKQQTGERSTRGWGSGWWKINKECECTFVGFLNSGATIYIYLSLPPSLACLLSFSLAHSLSPSFRRFHAHFPSKHIQSLG